MRIRHGHPWVFANEIESTIKGHPPGTQVVFCNAKGEALALGYGNPNSLIAGRVVTKNLNLKIDEVDFFVSLLSRSLRLRERIAVVSGSFRLCFSESDQLPGLIVDRYINVEGHQCFVVEVLTAGMEKADSFWCEVFEKFVNLENVGGIGWGATTLLIRKDAKVRAIEGLDLKEPYFVRPALSFSEPTRVRVFDCFSLHSVGAQPHVDSLLAAKEKSFLELVVHLQTGQKTGLFLDQRDNIRKVMELANLSQSQIRILDLFCYVGQWGAALAKAYTSLGIAAEVFGLDASQEAIERAKFNVTAAGGIWSGSKMDVVSGLAAFPETGFDFVICDPPGLIKNRKDIDKGRSAYVKLNRLALEKTKYGGVIVSCSCSHHMGAQEFQEVLAEAMEKSKRTVRWIYEGRQAADHPMRAEFPESIYLKCWIGIVL